MESAQADLEKVKAECEGRISEVEKTRDVGIIDLREKIGELESTLTQYEVEYNQKADEVDSMTQKATLSETLA
jgi:hypothetical protein